MARRPGVSCKGWNTITTGASSPGHCWAARKADRSGFAFGTPATSYERSGIRQPPGGLNYTAPYAFGIASILAQIHLIVHRVTTRFPAFNIRSASYMLCNAVDGACMDNPCRHRPFALHQCAWLVGSCEMVHHPITLLGDSSLDRRQRRVRKRLLQVDPLQAALPGDHYNATLFRRQ
jgi:hypothetical protein